MTSSSLSGASGALSRADLDDGSAFPTPSIERTLTPALSRVCIYDDIRLKEDPLLGVFTARLAYIPSSGTSFLRSALLRPPSSLSLCTLTSPCFPSVALLRHDLDHARMAGWGLVRPLDANGLETTLILAIQISQEPVVNGAD
jgi:hypothetical protein